MPSAAKFRSNAQSSPTTLHLFVDTQSVPDGADLQHLLSFDGVEGIIVESTIAIEQSAEGESIAILGPDRGRRILLPRLSQFSDIIEELLKEFGNSAWNANLIERTLGFAFLTESESADGLVTGVQEQVLRPVRDFAKTVQVLSVGQALAMVGAHVRQRNSVPLRGRPPLRSDRSEVYPITARAMVPIGQAWWVACVHKLGSQGEFLQLAEAVFGRLAQALRGRDSVHEALRTRDGRAAILESLYHLDVLLTSGVAALDALARVAHQVYGLPGKVWNIGWQKKEWRRQLKFVAPNVGAVLDTNSKYAGPFDVLRYLRNSIHAIPLTEFLYVERGANSSRVEHRAWLSADLLAQLQEPGIVTLLPAFGIFDKGNGPGWINVGQFAEEMLASIVLIIDAICSEMLATTQLPPAPPPAFDSLFQMFWDSELALARVGDYPYQQGPSGLRARPSLHRDIMGILHRAEEKVLSAKRAAE